MASVFIIGGGASGLISAIYAAKNGNNVTIIERNKTCGKKLLMTGNGRCNYWNSDQNILHYHSNNIDLIPKIINEKNLNEITSFFNRIGVIPKIKNSNYYPQSNQSLSILSSLMIEANQMNVKILNSIVVKEIIKVKEKFVINPKNENISADKVIIATGSLAFPRTGSDGIGYEIAQSFGHSIVKVLPSLVQLIGKEKYFKYWDGIRNDVLVSLYENNILIRRENGEIQLTNYGISGICVFNLSGLIARGLYNGSKEIISINFIPNIDVDNPKSFIEWINRRNKELNDRNINELLIGLLNNKLIEILLKISNININCKWNELSNEKKYELVKNIMSLNIEIIDTNSFDKSQVCSGGIPLNEINLNTMESNKEKGLYFVGEILDVDGDCGGYNLSFAWISGMLAGSSIKE